MTDVGSKNLCEGLGVVDAELLKVMELSNYREIMSLHKKNRANVAGFNIPSRNCKHL